VQVVFGGHNHYYAHALVGGVHHLTVGGGGAPLGNPSSNARYIISACSELSFVKVKISGSILLLEAVKYDGTVLDSFTIQR
jgi:hypothetical protein